LRSGARKQAHNGIKQSLRHSLRQLQQKGDNHGTACDARACRVTRRGRETPVLARRGKPEARVLRFAHTKSFADKPEKSGVCMGSESGAQAPALIDKETQ
jgi:hypothetical protein